MSEEDREALAARLSEGFSAQATLTDLTDRLAVRCMEEQGFKTHPEKSSLKGDRPPRPHESDNIEVAMGARLSPDEATVDTVGYGVSPRELVGVDLRRTSGQLVSAFDRLSRREQNRYWVAYQGYSPDEVNSSTQRINEDEVVLPNHETFARADGKVVAYPRQGCVADVQQRLFSGKIKQFYEYASYANDGLGGSAARKADGDDKVRDRTRQWSSCMKQKGYQALSKPADARNHAAGSYGAHIFGPGDPGYDDRKASEIAIAVADFECNRQVGLDDARVEAFWRNLTESYHDHEAEIVAWHQMVAEAKDRGQRLLAGKPVG